MLSIDTHHTHPHTHTLTVSPQIVIESVRQWLGGNNSVLFDKIVFSAKANINIIEKFLEDYFPLMQSTHRDSLLSEQSSMVDLESGIEISDNRNEPNQNEEQQKVFENKSEEKPFPFLPGLEAVNNESEDTIGDLPEIPGNTNKPNPLLHKTSVSDIGIQLEMNSDSDSEEQEKNVPVLKLSDTDSDDRLDSEDSTPSLLNILTRSPDLKTSSPLQIGSITPPCRRGSLTAPLSLPSPTRGLVVIRDNKSRSPSPGTSPRVQSKNNVSSLVLNPERVESDV